LTQRSADQHAHFRDLISARLDGSLKPADGSALRAHLKACPNCRQVDHDYSEQRRLLRSLPPQAAPRDLWARTSAALDRELLRESSPGYGRRRSAVGAGLTALTRPLSVPSVLLVSAVSLTMATVLVITQMGPNLRFPNPAAGPNATPFDGGVALAFVGADKSGLVLYRTRVDEGCPNAAECPGEDAVQARVTFPASFQPSTLALAPRGDRLAIMGSDTNSESVFAVMDLPPFNPSNAGDAPSRPRPRGPLPSTSPTPEGSVVVVTRTPSPGAGGTGQVTTDVVMSTILDDVLGVGAAPAWSADGLALAFSAMPSDRSAGPDIYLWKVGDVRARPITGDHRSYFASWAANTNVVSRADVSPATVFSGPVITNLAINVATREQRTVRGPELWLPQVDPSGRRAVGWHGQLGWSASEVVPLHGELYLVDWAALDPFGAAAPVAVPTADAVDMSGGGAPVILPPLASGGDDPPARPIEEPTPRATDSVSGPLAPVESENPSGPVTDRRLIAIEPDRDPIQHSVTDWRVQWSADGRMLAQWIADESSKVWGRLSVIAIGQDGGLLAPAILTPTAAKRGFNLASNRVAWVAPSEDSLSGDLRLRVWGAAGFHDVHVKPTDSAGVVAAF
jgi:hypothetical protein